MKQFITAAIRGRFTSNGLKNKNQAPTLYAYTDYMQPDTLINAMEKSQANLTSDSISYIGLSIAYIRKKLRLKSKDIAIQVGISPNYLSLIEKGKRTPSQEVLQDLGNALCNTPLSFIYLKAEVLESKNPAKFKELLETSEQLVEKFYWKNCRQDRQENISS